MAKRSKTQRRSRRFGLPAAHHAVQARGSMMEIRRLTRKLRKQIAAGDCVHAASLMNAISQQEGAFWISRDSAGGGRGRYVPHAHAIFQKFVKACIRPAMPRSARRTFGRK